MGKVVKKVCYLRQDQVEKMLEYVYQSYRDGVRGLNESALCRVGLDLLLNTGVNIGSFHSEEELLQACLYLLQKKEPTKAGEVTMG